MHGGTPLVVAAGEGQCEVLGLLLDRGANLEHQNYLGETPLFFAIRSRSLETVRLLLERGVDLGHCTKDGGTPLHSAAAAQGAHWEAMQLLLDRGANVDQQDTRGKTPLDLALEDCIEGHSLDAVYLLVRSAGEQGNVPLLRQSCALL
jgi:ankyrin repeat protein